MWEEWSKSFDNWDERAALESEARKLGISPEQLMVIVPDRFENQADGPCHPPALRKQFWTDVLKSLELSHDTLFEYARQRNSFAKEDLPDEFIEDLEERVDAIRTSSENVTPRCYTRTQGRYLAFIYYYSKVHGYPPAEADIQRFMRVSPPAVHQMILTLERRGLIERTPGQARTIRVLLPLEELPALE